MALAAILLASCDGDQGKVSPPLPDGAAAPEASARRSLDCSTVGCVPAPPCSTGCADECGCCSCRAGAERVFDGRRHVCDDSTYALPGLGSCYRAIDAGPTDAGTSDDGAADGGTSGDDGGGPDAVAGTTDATEA